MFLLLTFVMVFILQQSTTGAKQVDIRTIRGLRHCNPSLNGIGCLRQQHKELLSPMPTEISSEDSCTVKMSCGDAFIAASTATSIQQCRQDCHNQSHCHYFTWFSGGPFSNTCFQFKNCKKFVLSCTHCHTGTSKTCKNSLPLRPNHVRTFLN